MSDSHAQQGTNIIKFLLACWMLGDMISDLYTLITEYWAECAKEEGDCSYFIVGLASLIAPTILALIVLNILFCSGKSSRKVIATFTTFGVSINLYIIYLYFWSLSDHPHWLEQDLLEVILLECTCDKPWL